MYLIIYFVLFWSGEKEDFDMRLDRLGDKFRAVFSLPVHRGDAVVDNNDVLIVDDSTSSAVCTVTASEVLVNS